jgi:hypothetical protein
MPPGMAFTRNGSVSSINFNGMTIAKKHVNKRAGGCMVYSQLPKNILLQPLLQLRDDLFFPAFKVAFEYLFSRLTH